MQTHVATTPFGRRPMTLGQISSQMVARAAPPEAVAHKWQVFQHIREAREVLGATDRALAILNALLTFHPETVLTGTSELVVWPSNEQLMARANGMPATTLRRHIAVLVDCGLIVRRDSPNGKRFARKGRGGEIAQAYGFDLAPLVARAAEFKDLANSVRAEKDAVRVAKERLTLLRRDIVKMIDAGTAEQVPGNWGGVLKRYQAIVARLPRSAPRQLVESICEELRALWSEIRDVLESFAKTQNPDANESHPGRHIQNSNPDPLSESEQGSPADIEATGGAETGNLRSLPKRDLPLGIVLEACPSFVELAPDGKIRHWRDAVRVADLARPMLGVSPSAWQAAREALGEQQAAVTLAAIYQRADQISSPGGYLRSLTERARQGKFSTWPMIMALLRAKLEAGRPARTDVGGALAASQLGSSCQVRVSSELLRSLEKHRRR
jgi:replication initiation protein RepC